MNHYRIFKGNAQRYGVEEKDKYGWGLLYEADDDKETAELMARLLNLHGFMDWEHLRVKMEATGWRDAHSLAPAPAPGERP